MRLNVSGYSHTARAVCAITNNQNLVNRTSNVAYTRYVRVSKPTPISITTLVRQSSTDQSKEKTPFYKKMFGAKTQDQINHETEIQEKIDTEESILREIEAEEREEKIRKKRNRSRLHFSHRSILKGEPPQVGLHMEWDDSQKTRAYKAQLLGKYGRSKTGIDPSICWPTPEEIADEYEKERVYYDNTSLKEILENDKRMQQEEKDAIKLREKDIDEKLARMNKDLDAWKTRLDNRKKQAQKEIEKRTKILAELRQEYGYDVNANLPQFKEKYAAKEKEFAKRAKEEKRIERAERKKAYDEAQKDETPDETEKGS